MRTLTLRELNRTLLAREMLLARKRVPAVRAVERLVALQAQYAPSPYVALWARVASFGKEQLTRALVDGSVVKATSMRETLHVTTRELYADLVSAQIDRLRARTEKLPATGANPHHGHSPVTDAHTAHTDPAPASADEHAPPATARPHRTRCLR